MKKSIALTLIISFFIFVFNIFPENYSADSNCIIEDCENLIDVYSDETGGFYLLCNKDENYKILYINAKMEIDEYSLDISVNENLYAYFNNQFYFFENSVQKENGADKIFLTVNIFNCTNGVLKKKVINDAYFATDSTFAIDDEYNYYLIENNKINVYSKNSIFQYSFDIGSKPYNLTNTYDGNTIFCTSADCLAVINGNNLSTYSINANKVFSQCNNYFSTDTGEVYLNDNSSLSFICNFNDSSNGVAVLNDYILGIDNGMLTSFLNGEKTPLCDINNNSFLCSSNNICGCFSQDDENIAAKFITLEEIEEKISETDTESTSVNPENNTFKNDIYNFHLDTGIITGVEPSSTIATIKKNINLVNCTSVFYDHNGNIKTSGNIGTGAKIDIIANDRTLTFNIIVYGDLSGEGNINTKDKTLLYDHLLGKSQLNEYNLMAADLNNDNTVDLKDLVALNSYLNNQYTITQKR